MQSDRERSEARALLTVRQTAEYLNVHPNTVRRWSQQGVLNSFRIGPRGDRRFLLADVESLLQTIVGEVQELKSDSPDD